MQIRLLGLVSRKSRELFGPEKSFVKLRPAYSVKLVFLYVVKGIKIKITAKFRASRRLSFEDTKRIISPEIRPKSFGTFEKQATGHMSERTLLAVAVVEALSTRRGSQTELTIGRSIHDGFGYKRVTFRFQDRRDHDTGNLGKQMYSTNHIFIPVLCTTLVKEILNKK